MAVGVDLQRGRTTRRYWPPKSALFGRYAAVSVLDRRTTIDRHRTGAFVCPSPGTTFFAQVTWVVPPQNPVIEAD